MPTKKRRKENMRRSIRQELVIPHDHPRLVEARENEEQFVLPWGMESLVQFPMQAAEAQGRLNCREGMDTEYNPFISITLRQAWERGYNTELEAELGGR